MPLGPTLVGSATVMKLFSIYGSLKGMVVPVCNGFHMQTAISHSCHWHSTWALRAVPVWKLKQKWQPHQHLCFISLENTCGSRRRSVQSGFHFCYMTIIVSHIYCWLPSNFTFGKQSHECWLTAFWCTTESLMQSLKQQGTKWQVPI